MGGLLLSVWSLLCGEHEEEEEEESEKKNKRKEKIRNKEKYGKKNSNLKIFGRKIKDNL
jgi:hypothetical protein